MDVAFAGVEVIVGFGEFGGVAGECGDGVALVEGLVDEVLADAAC